MLMISPFSGLACISCLVQSAKNVEIFLCSLVHNSKTHRTQINFLCFIFFEADGFLQTDSDFECSNISFKENKADDIAQMLLRSI